MRGQAGVEYTILLAVSIAIFAIVIFLVLDQVSAVGKSRSLDAARAAIEEIKQAAKEVYYQGKDARKTVTITIPDGTTVSQITNNTIALKHYQSDIFVKTDFPIYGTLPQNPGTYAIEVVSEGINIRIGPAIFTASPTSIIFDFCSRNTSQFYIKEIKFTNLQNYSININLLLPWTHTNVTLNLSESSFSLPSTSSKNISVTANVNSNAVGTFSGSITATSGNASITIPVSVVVAQCAALPNISYVTIATFKDYSYTIPRNNFPFPPNITITTGNWTPSGSITIKIRDPSQSLVYEDTKLTNTTGGYKLVWTSSRSLGNYTIYVNDSEDTVNSTFGLVSCS